MAIIEIIKITVAKITASYHMNPGCKLIDPSAKIPL